METQGETPENIEAILGEIRDLQRSTKAATQWIAFLVSAWAVLFLLTVLGAIEVEVTVAGF